MARLSKSELEGLLAAGAGTLGVGGIVTAKRMRGTATRGTKLGLREHSEQEKQSGFLRNAAGELVDAGKALVRATLDPKWAAQARPAERGAAYLGVASVPGTAMYLNSTKGRRLPPPRPQPQRLGPPPSLIPKYSSTAGDIAVGGGVGAALGGGASALATQQILHRMIPLDEAVETALLDLQAPVRARLEMNIDRAEAGMREGMQRAVEARLAAKPKGMGPRLLHRVLRSTDPVNTLGLDSELGAWRNMDIPGQVDEGLGMLAGRAKQTVRSVLTDPKFIRAGATVGAVGGGLLGALLASPLSAGKRARRAEETAQKSLDMHYAWAARNGALPEQEHGAFGEPVPPTGASYGPEMSLGEYYPEKISAGFLANLLSKNRAAASGGSRKDLVTRRDFLKRMGRGAVANSPVGNLDHVKWDRVHDAAINAVSPAVAGNVKMTRRQALGAIPAAAAVQGSALVDAASAIQPSMGKSMMQGAMQAVNPVRPGAVAARTAGTFDTRRKFRAAEGAHKMMTNPTQDKWQNVQRVAVGAPKVTAAVMKSMLTAA